MDSVRLSALLSATGNTGAGRAALAPVPGGGSAPVPKADIPAPVSPPLAPVVTLTENSGNTESARQAIEAAVRQIRQFIKNSPANNLEFSLDDQSGRVLLRIMDGQTKELIRQVPSEEVLAVARALDRFEGLLLRQKA